MTTLPTFLPLQPDEPDMDEAGHHSIHRDLESNNNNTQQIQRLQMPRSSPAPLDTLPQEVILRLFTFFEGIELISLRLVSLRWNQLWVAFGIDFLRPILHPPNALWSARLRSNPGDLQAREQTRSKAVTKHVAQQQIAVTAAAWLRRLRDTGTRALRAAVGAAVPSLGEPSPTFGRRDEFPNPVQELAANPEPAAEQSNDQIIEPQPSAVVAVNGQNSPEEDGDNPTSPAQSPPQGATRSEELRNGEIPLQTSVGESSIISNKQWQTATKLVSLLSSPNILKGPPPPMEQAEITEQQRRREAIVKQKQTMQMRRARALWLADMRQFWNVRRNIHRGLFQFTSLDKHSHAIPVVLPNGTVIISRWQMLNCFVKIWKEESHPVLFHDTDEGKKRLAERKLSKRDQSMPWLDTEDNEQSAVEMAKKNRPELTTFELRDDPKLQAAMVEEDEEDIHGSDPTKTDGGSDPLWSRTGHIVSHRDTITVLRYHQHSDTVLSASLDGLVKVWRARMSYENPNADETCGKTSCCNPCGTHGGEVSGDLDDYNDDHFGAYEDYGDDPIARSVTAREDWFRRNFDARDEDPITPEPPMPRDAPWLQCLYTFDVTAYPTHGIPRNNHGIYCLDVMEIEDHFGDRALTPLIVVGMESGYIVLILCDPGGWRVLGWHNTQDVRVHHVKFLNHVPFSPRSDTTLSRRKSASSLSGALHPEDEEEEEEAARKYKDREIDSGRAVLETEGRVHVVAAAIATVVVVEFKLRRKVNFISSELAYNMMQMSTSATQEESFIDPLDFRVLWSRRDGISGGSVDRPLSSVPLAGLGAQEFEWTDAKSTPPIVVYDYVPCDPGRDTSCALLVAMFDVVSLDVPPLCHSSQFPFKKNEELTSPLGTRGIYPGYSSNHMLPPRIAPYQGNIFWQNPCALVVCADSKCHIIAKQVTSRSADAPEGSPTGGTDNDATNGWTPYVNDIINGSGTGLTCAKFSPTNALIAAGFETGAVKLLIRRAVTDGKESPRARRGSMVFGELPRADPLATRILQTTLPMDPSEADGCLTAVQLYPAHTASVSTVHVDDWKVTSVDVLSTVHVYSMITRSLLWIVSQRPHPFSPCRTSYSDYAVHLDSIAHPFLVRHIVWHNATLIVSPLGITKHTFIADFGGQHLPGDTDAEGGDPVLPISPTSLMVGEAKVLVRQGNPEDVEGQLLQTNQETGERAPETATASVQGESRTVRFVLSPNGAAHHFLEHREPHPHATLPDSLKKGNISYVPDPYSPDFRQMHMQESSEFYTSTPPTNTSIRVIYAEPVALQTHLMHLINLPLSLFSAFLTIIFACLRLDGLIDWTFIAVFTPHIMMLPYYALLNVNSYNGRLLQHAGSPHILRGIVDFLYLVLFPLLFALRHEPVAPDIFQSLSWTILTLPLSLSIVLNLFATSYERRIENMLRLNGTDNTTRNRNFSTHIDLIIAALGLIFVWLLSSYFDAPPKNPDYWFSSSAAMQNLPIGVVFLPIWIFLLALCILVPRLPVFTRAWSCHTISLLIGVYASVAVFLLLPILLFCLKYDNYYNYARGTVTDTLVLISNSTNESRLSSFIQSTSAPFSNSTADEFMFSSNLTDMNRTVIPVYAGTSTIPDVEKIPVTAVFAPVLLMLLIFVCTGVSNVYMHYQRLTRGLRRL